MVEYGTNIVAGVTPGKGGIKTLNNTIPVFNLVSEAVEQKKKLILLLSLYLLLSQQMQLLSLPSQE
jgi:succinyl-CoA synthetase alpha subunit